MLKALGASLMGGTMLPLIGCTQQKKLVVVDMITDGGDEIFAPDRIRIQPGDTVQWRLASGFHSATAYHPDNSDHPLRIPQSAQAWDSGMLKQDGDTFEVVFQQEGAYGYYCTPHEALGMAGLVVVGTPTVNEPGLMPPQASLPKAAITALSDFNDWAMQFTKR